MERRAEAAEAAEAEAAEAEAAEAEAAEAKAAEADRSADGSHYSREEKEPVNLVGNVAQGDLEIEKAYEYCDLDPSTRLVEYEDTDDVDFCFLCSMRSKHSAHEGNPFLRRLHLIIRDNYAQVSAEAFTSMVQEFYNTQIRPRIAHPQDRRVWTKRSILEHVELHAPSRYTDTVRNLRLVRSAMNLLGTRMKLKNVQDDKDVKLDTANLKLFTQLLKDSQRLGAEAESLVTAFREQADDSEVSADY